jgi:AraC family transcriptional activator of pobA
LPRCQKLLYLQKKDEMNTLSISEFVADGVNVYGEDLLITDSIKHVELFKFPCRIDAITIVVCIKGAMSCRVNLKDYNLKGNDIIVNFPENIIQVGSTSDFEGFVLLVSMAMLDKLHIDIKKKIDSYMNLRERPLMHVTEKDIECLRYYYYLFKENMYDKCSDTGEIMRGLVSSVVFKIISMVNRSSKIVEEIVPDKPNIQMYFDEFMSLLSTFHTTERSIGFYADKMNLTCNYLSNIVKEYSGKPASYWVGEYVILEAEVLLKMAGMNVQQVAYRLNFPSQSMFGKYFKKHTGVTPKEYIKGR